MNSRYLVIGVIIVVVVLGIWLVLMPAPAAAPSSDVSVATTSTPEAAKPATVPKTTTPIKGGSTYTSLLTQKGNYQCDYDQVQSTGQGHNVIYLSDGKMRAEFHNIAGDVTVASLSVYDGHYLYAWDEGKSVGTRTVITSLGQLPTAIPKDLTSGKIYGTAFESVGWKCHTWLVDKTLLTPPSYVKFN